MRIWVCLLVELIGLSCLTDSSAVTNSQAGIAAATPYLSTNSLTQDIYIWQRSWNVPVRESVEQHASHFAEVVPLIAEVVWKQNRPDLIHVALDFSALKNAGSLVGLAMRVGVYSGDFSTNAPATVYLANLAASLLNEAKSNQLTIKELQIDFDCAESKLEGYRNWVETIKKRIAPCPLVITALPSWLSHDSFAQLALASDGYILQVHSITRPKDPTSVANFSICDIPAAKRAVVKAGQIGVPFRVALPTYGYTVAFSREGIFLGLSAEGPARTWPEDAQVREVRSNPVELSALVKEWSGEHPGVMNGIIWYRMPISLDTLNWSWPTLSAVMAGRVPRESVAAKVNRPKAGLVEISLVNDGEADLSSRPAVEVRWQKARLVAADGLRGFEVLDSGPTTLQFRTKINSTPGRLLPGERQVIGWLRFSEEVEVQVETKKL